MKSSQIINQNSWHPVTWALWLEWVMVGAVAPVAYAFAWMAVNKQILATDPNASLIWLATWTVIALSLLVPTVLQWRVLKKIVPSITLLAWALMLLFVVGVWLGVEYTLLEWKWPSTKSFNIAAHKARYDFPLNWTKLTTLPWTSLLITTATSAVLYWAVVPIMLGRLAGRLHKCWPFLIGLVAASCLTVIFKELYEVWHISSDIKRLNGIRWSRRINELLLYATAGGAGAAVSGWGLALMFPSSSKHKQSSPTGIGGLTTVVSTVVILWNAGGFLVHLNGPKGLRTGFPGLLRTLSSAPTTDELHGEAIINFSHLVNVKTYRFPNTSFAKVEFARDGKSFTVKTDTQPQAHIDTATGAVLDQTNGSGDRTMTNIAETPKTSFNRGESTAEMRIGPVFLSSPSGTIRKNRES